MQEAGTGDAGGEPATGEAGAAGAPVLEPTLRGDALLHRYSFSGTGTQALDSKGAAHGSLLAAQLTDTGALQLDGTTAEYVDLPNGLISGLYDATFEVWMTWTGGPVWQRIFDFGDDDTGMEDGHGLGRSYLFLSPHGNGDFLRAVYKNAMIREVIVDVKPALPTGTESYLAVVFDDTHDHMNVYVNGVLSGSVELDSKLSQIHDINDWLGRSQFGADAHLAGQLNELRIYDAALTDAEIQKSFESGPDVVFPEP